MYLKIQNMKLLLFAFCKAGMTYTSNTIQKLMTVKDIPFLVEELGQAVVKSIPLHMNKFQ